MLPEQKMKKSKLSISITSELLEAFKKRFNVGNGVCLSAAIQGCMIATLTDQRPYWTHRARIAAVELKMCTEALDSIRSQLLEQTNKTKTNETRKRIYNEIMDTTVYK
jgi:hypothetical protein